MHIFRKTVCHIWILGLLGLLFAEGLVHAQAVPDDERLSKKEVPPAVPGVVIVKLKPGVSGKSGVATLGHGIHQINNNQLKPLFPGVAISDKRGSIEGSSELGQYFEMRYGSSEAPHVVARLLAQDDRVAFAEPRYIYSLSNGKGPRPVTHMQPASPSITQRVAPNDPQYNAMSHLRHVNMPEAWDIVKASDGNVVIGIVDGGVDWEHDDLRDNVWRNPVEVDNGRDDDGNGFVDDLFGWNFPDNSNDPRGLSRTPENGRHGTMVAGVAVAVTDNNTGISGASWNAEFIPVNAGCSTVDNAVCFGYEGIIYAAREGADIVNVSWGGPDSFLGREVIRIVRDLGALVIVSAGNGGSLEDPGINLDEMPSYPANYDGVLVVGATGKDDDIKALFSNYGVSVDVFAPGVNLNSTIPGDDYTIEGSGTSFAAPFVAGVAALVKTEHDEWDMEQVREQIRATSQSIEDANDSNLNGFLGSGRVDAVSALTDTNIPAVRVTGLTFTESDMDGSIQEGEAVDVTLDLFNYLAPATGVTYSVTTSDTLVSIEESFGTLGRVGTGSSTAAGFSFQLAEEMPNDYPLRFNVTIEGDGFSSTELIDLVVNRITHDTGVLQVSLSDEGNIGWADFEEISEGQGFNYFGVNWLFEGGLLVAVGEDRVLNSIRNEEQLRQDTDFERVRGSKFGVLPGTVTAENGLVIMRERSAEQRVGLRIHQESYADTQTENTNFIILRYFLSLPELNTPTLNNVYVGLFMDWDLTTGGDYARFDANRRLGMVQNSADSPILVFGTKLLTTSAGISYRSIQNDEIFDDRSGGDGFTEAEKWAFMSGGIQTESADDDDVSTLIAAGPYQVLPGEPIEVAFALIAATSTDNMNRFADNAQRLWDLTISTTSANPVSVEDEGNPLAFSLKAAYPNPVFSGTTIPFTMPHHGTARLELYDMLGRKIKTLLDTEMLPGVHTSTWDRKNDLGHAVSSGTYIYRLTVTASDRTYTASRPLIVIR